MSEMSLDEMKVFDWDDEIEDDGEEISFVTLEEGDYEFTVEKLEKELYSAKAGGKIPDCNMAVITMKVETPEGYAYVRDRFYLVQSCEWRISSFFRCIGLKKHGERLRMKWTESIGCKGEFHVTKDAGNKENTFFNNVKYYIDPVVNTSEGDDGGWN